MKLPVFDINQALCFLGSGAQVLPRLLEPSESPDISTFAVRPTLNISSWQSEPALHHAIGSRKMVEHRHGIAQLSAGAISYRTPIFCLRDLLSVSNAVRGVPNRS